MTKCGIDLNRLYDGSDIVNFFLDGLFEVGDTIIGFKGDFVGRYVLSNEVYGLNFCSEDGDKLDFWDLVNLKFAIVPREEEYFDFDSAVYFL